MQTAQILVHLEELDVQETPVGTSYRHIIEAVGAWEPDAPLQKLELTLCKIPVEMCRPLILALSNHGNLKELHIVDHIITFLDPNATNSFILHKTCGPFSNLESLSVPLGMPLHASRTILSALSNFQHLQHLSLSGNTLTGCLWYFLSMLNAELPALHHLYLRSAELNEDNILHVTHLINGDKVPQLWILFMSNNNLGRMEHVVDGLIEACVSHWKRNRNHSVFNKPYVSLDDNNFSSEFKRKWDAKVAIQNGHSYIYW